MPKIEFFVSNLAHRLARIIIIVFSLCMMLTVFSANTTSAKSTPSENAYIAALPAWQEVLDQFVDDQGRVNFHALAQTPEGIDTIISAIGKVSPSTHEELFPSRNAVLAYHMNTYNALAMYGVLEREIPKNFSSFIKRASFFKFRKVIIGGEKSNLHKYENKVIRPLDEPRAHFALNCMVKDCPRLPKKIFTEQTIEAQLEALTVEFVNSDKHVKVNKEEKRVYVSAIFKFYTEDFVASGKADDLLEYINPYRINEIPSDYTVKYLKYDWTVNRQP